MKRLVKIRIHEVHQGVNSLVKKCGPQKAGSLALHLLGGLNYMGQVSSQLRPSNTTQEQLTDSEGRVI